jgi:hypothetical protein
MNLLGKLTWPDHSKLFRLQRMAHELSRQALYRLIWSKAKTKIAKGFWISDAARGKTCKKANIPVPPRGYWASRDTRQRRARFPLPVRGLGQIDTVPIGQERRWYRDEPIGELPSPPGFSESMDTVIWRAQQLAGKVNAPQNLDRPHLLVAKLLAQNLGRQQKVTKRPYYWDAPRFEAPSARPRLRLTNALFLALAKAGCRPDYRGQDAEELYAHVADHVIEKARPSFEEPGQNQANFTLCVTNFHSMRIQFHRMCNWITQPLNPSSTPRPSDTR